MRTWFQATLAAAVTALFAVAAQAEEGRGDFDSRKAFDAQMQAQGTRSLEAADDGSYAWSESYVMMSLVTMYEVTGDTAYLDRFIEHADVVLANRDSVLGRTDYRGRSQPGWTAGEHYSIGEIELNDADGTPVLYLRTALTGYNSATKVTVSKGEHPATFTLHIVNERYNREGHFENLSMDPVAETYALSRIHASPLAQPFSYMRLHAKDLRDDKSDIQAIPAPVETTLEPSRTLWPVHQGMILEPMTRFARVVHESPALQASPAYVQKAFQYLQAAETLFAVLENDWRQNDDGEGWYAFAKGVPIWMDGCDEPHNHYLAVGTAMLNLVAVTKHPVWTDHVTRMATTLRNDMRHQPETDALIWPYWWSKGHVYNGWGPEDDVSINTPGKHPTQSIEDFSHASIDVGFAVKCFRDGVVFTRQDMARLCNTFMRNIVRRKENGDITFAGRVDGSGPLGRYDKLGPNWVLLAQFHPAVLDCFREIRADSPWSGYAVWMLQSANMNLMAQRLER